MARVHCKFLVDGVDHVMINIEARQNSASHQTSYQFTTSGFWSLIDDPIASGSRYMYNGSPSESTPMLSEAGKVARCGDDSTWSGPRRRLHKLRDVESGSSAGV